MIERVSEVESLALTLSDCLHKITKTKQIAVVRVPAGRCAIGDWHALDIELEDAEPTVGARRQVLDLEDLSRAGAHRPPRVDGIG